MVDCSSFLLFHHLGEPIRSSDGYGTARAIYLSTSMKTLTALYKHWEYFSEILEKVVSTLVLTLLYLFVVPIFSLLHLVFRKPQKSGWLEKKTRPLDVTFFESMS